MQLLHAHDDVDGLADLVAARPWRQLEAAGVSFARVVAGMLGDREPAVVDALIALARAVETDDPALRRTLLARADAATAATGDARRRAVVAELAGDAWRRGDVDAADELAGAVLAEASPREVETRARALYARAVADTIRCTPPALARARDEFGESAALAELCGRYRWAADALLRTGYAVSFHGGAVDEAIAPIERALALGAGGRSIAGRRAHLPRRCARQRRADDRRRGGLPRGAGHRRAPAGSTGDRVRLLGERVARRPPGRPRRHRRLARRGRASSRPLAGRGERRRVLPRRGRHALVAR